MLPLILSSLALGFPPTSFQGELDPQAREPYHLEVVLGFAEHPLLRGSFPDRVEREVRDGLRAELGNLARVEVMRKHPQLRDVIARGLYHAFDTWKGLSNKKTHFVLIDHDGSEYRIQARQYDGLTGMASLVVRTRQIPDRVRVAHEIADLVAQDFGVVGTITSAQEDRVSVTIKGGQLEGASNALPKKGDVFAVAQILNQGGEQRSERLEWCLLQLLEPPQSGVCQCLLYHRFQNPLTPAPGSLGFRCLKLGTSESSIVRLRVVDEKGLPQSGVVVKFGKAGFGDDQVEIRSTDSNGVAVTQRPYQNIAFVKLLEGTVPLAQVPVEVLEDRTVLCAITKESGAEEKNRLRNRLNGFIARLAETVESTNRLFDLLHTNAQKLSPAEALPRAQNGLQRLKTNLSNLRVERDELQKATETAGPENKLDFTEIDKRLDDLGKQQGVLQSYIETVEKNLAEEKDPKRQRFNQLIQNAKLRESQLDIQAALDLYDEALKSGYEIPELKKKVEALREQWKTKSLEHSKARNFLYNTWPDQHTAKDIKAKLPEAQKAFEVCKGAGDLFTPLKLLKVNGELADRILKEKNSLNLAFEDDQDTAQIIAKLAPKLIEFNTDVGNYVKEHEKSR